MKKAFSLLLALIMLCAFSACGGTKKINGTKIIIREQPAFGDETALSIDEHVLTPDGSLVHTVYKLYGEDGKAFERGDEQITYQKATKVDPKEFKNLMETAAQADFFSLPEEIETEVSDGNYTYLTIESEDGNHTVGGLEASQLGPGEFKNLYNEFVALCTIAGV